MRNVLALAAAALVVVAATQLVANVGATGQATVARRVAVLEKKVGTLRRSLKTTQGKLTALREDWGCLKGRGLTQWGNGTGTPRSGFQYSNDGGKTYALLPAVALTTGNNQPDVWMVVTDEGCLPGAST